jgi:hypothetical protein
MAGPNVDTVTENTTRMRAGPGLRPATRWARYASWVAVDVFAILQGPLAGTLCLNADFGFHNGQSITIPKSTHYLDGLQHPTTAYGVRMGAMSSAVGFLRHSHSNANFVA